MADGTDTAAGGGRTLSGGERDRLLPGAVGHQRDHAHAHLGSRTRSGIGGWSPVPAEELPAETLARRAADDGYSVTTS
jgi:hypothetical protein